MWSPILPLLALAIPAIKAQERSINVDPQLVYFSPLSPLTRYDPPDAWNFSYYGAHTTTPGASVSFDWMGSDLLLWGEQWGATAQNDPPIVLLGGSGVNQDNWMINRTSPTYSARMSRWYQTATGTIGGVSLKQRTFTATVNEVQEGEAFLNLTSVNLRTEIPGNVFDENDYRFITESTIIDNQSNPFFTSDGWQVTPAHRYARNSLIPVDWVVSRNATEVWQSNSTVLSTTQVNTPLRFSVPDEASILYILGAVGTQHGEFELRLFNRSEQIDLGLHGNVRSANAERPINSSSELIMYAYLDPRVKYDAEVVSTQDGRRLDVDGIATVALHSNPQELESNWLEDYNKYYGHSGGGGGLSGGQIAGIVIGSVAGAAMIGGAVWFFLRRRKGQQSTRTPAGVREEDVHTLNDEPVTKQTV